MTLKFGSKFVKLGDLNRNWGQISRLILIQFYALRINYKYKIPLVIFTRSPEDHDDTEDDREEEMPECVVHPEIPPLGETLDYLVVLDAPEHEDDAGEDAEHQGVGEVFVHGQLNQVSPEPQLPRGGH